MDISGAGVGPWHIALIAAWITHHDRVTALRVRDNPVIGTREKDGTEGPDAFIGAWRRVVAALSESSNIVALDLYDVGMGPVGLDALTDGTLIEQLTSLQIGSNRLIEDEQAGCWERFCALLAKDESQLQVLDVSNIGLHPRALVCLADSIILSPDVTDLDLSGNPLTTTTKRDGRERKDSSGLASLLMASTFIRSLDLSEAGLTDDCAEVIAHSLADLPTIEALKLWGNGEIGVKGATLVASQLRRAPSLRFLSIGFSRSSGFAVPTNDDAVVELQCSKAGLEAADAILIAAAMSTLPELTSMDISGQKIGPAGKMAIAAALRERTKRSRQKCMTKLTVDLGQRHRPKELKSTGTHEYVLKMDTAGLTAADVLCLSAFLYTHDAVDMLNLSGNGEIFAEVEDEDFDLFVETLKNKAEEGGEAQEDGLVRLGSFTGSKKVAHLQTAEWCKAWSKYTSRVLGTQRELSRDSRLQLPGLAPETRLCDHAVWRLSRSLAATPELFISNLNLATMNLSHAHLQVLANGLDRRYREGQMGTIDLHGNPCLTRQQNSDDEEETLGLRMFLGSFTKIEELKLDGCLLGDQGAAELAQHLHKITVLYISSNPIGVDGAQAIADKVPEAKKLRQMRLGAVHSVHQVQIPVYDKTPASLPIANRDLDDAHAIIIAAALPTLPSLTLVDISGNEFCSPGKAALARAIPQLPAMKTFRIGIGESHDKFEFGGDDEDKRETIGMAELYDVRAADLWLVAAWIRSPLAGIKKLSLTDNEELLDEEDLPAGTSQDEISDNPKHTHSSSPGSRRTWTREDTRSLLSDVAATVVSSNHVRAPWQELCSAVRTSKIEVLELTNVSLRTNEWCIAALAAVIEETASLRSLDIAKNRRFKATKRTADGTATLVLDAAKQTLAEAIKGRADRGLQPLRSFILSLGVPSGPRKLETRFDAAGKVHEEQTIRLRGKNLISQDAPLLVAWLYMWEQSRIKGVSAVKAVSVLASDNKLGLAGRRSLIDAMTRSKGMTFATQARLHLDFARAAIDLCNPVPEGQSAVNWSSRQIGQKQALLLAHWLRDVVSNPANRPTEVDLSNNPLLGQWDDVKDELVDLLVDHAEARLDTRKRMTRVEAATLIQAATRGFLARKTRGLGRNKPSSTGLVNWGEVTTERRDNPKDTAAVVFATTLRERLGKKPLLQLTEQALRDGILPSKLEARLRSASVTASTTSGQPVHGFDALVSALAQAAGSRVSVLRLAACGLLPTRMQALTAAITAMGELRELYLSDNPLGIGQYINIHETEHEEEELGFEALVAGLPRCRKLRILDLSACRMSPSSGRALACHLALLAEPLLTLDISRNDLLGSTGGKAIADAVVVLGRDKRTPVEAVAIGSIAEDEVLVPSLRHDAPKPPEKAILPLTERGHKEYQLDEARELAFADQQLSPGLAAILGAWLTNRAQQFKKEHMQIRRVCLAGNLLSGTAFFPKGKTSKKQRREDGALCTGRIRGQALHAQKTQLDADVGGFGVLCAAFALRSIRNVDLSHCGLGPEAMSVSPGWLEEANLSHLNLSFNPLGVAGRERLRQALHGADIKHLIIDIGAEEYDFDASKSYLDFSETHNLTPEDAIVLAGWVRAKQVQRHLTELNVSHNVLIDDSRPDQHGFQDLCEAIPSSSITAFDAEDIGLTPDSTECLADMVKHAAHLTALRIADNAGITSDAARMGGWRKLCESFAASTSIAEIDLSSCGLEEKWTTTHLAPNLAKIHQGQLKKLTLLGNPCADSDKAIENLRAANQSKIKFRKEKQNDSSLKDVKARYLQNIAGISVAATKSAHREEATANPYNTEKGSAQAETETVRAVAERLKRLSRSSSSDGAAAPGQPMGPSPRPEPARAQHAAA